MAAFTLFLAGCAAGAAFVYWRMKLRMREDFSAKEQLHSNLEDVLISYRLAPVPVAVDSKRLCAIASKAVAAGEEDWQVDRFDADDDTFSDEKGI